MEVINLEVKNITCWFYTNKLSINVEKSNFIIGKIGKYLIWLLLLVITQLIVIRKLLFLV